MKGIVGNESNDYVKVGLPDVVWLGKEDGSWVIQAFDNPSQVIYWLQYADKTKKRRAWKIDLSTVCVCEYGIQTFEPQLVPVENKDDRT